MLHLNVTYFNISCEPLLHQRNVTPDWLPLEIHIYSHVWQCMNELKHMLWDTPFFSNGNIHLPTWWVDTGSFTIHSVGKLWFSLTGSLKSSYKTCSPLLAFINDFSVILDANSVPIVSLYLLPLCYMSSSILPILILNYYNLLFYLHLSNLI